MQNLIALVSYLLQLRDAAKQDFPRLSYAKLESEQSVAAAGLQALTSVLRGHERDDPDLPFSGEHGWRCWSSACIPYE